MTETMNELLIIETTKYFCGKNDIELQFTLLPAEKILRERERERTVKMSNCVHEFW